MAADGQSRMRRFMQMAGNFLADKVGIVAAESVVRVWWHGIMVLPPVFFVFEGGSVGVFKGGDMVGGEMPSISVLS